MGSSHYYTVLALRARLPYGLQGLLLASLAYGLLRPFLSLLRLSTMLGTAGALQSLAGSGLADLFIRSTPGDPVYKSVGIGVLSGIDPMGLVVREPLGGWLHAALPEVFVAPKLLSSGGWAGVVTEGPTTVLAQLLVRLSGHAAILALGLGMLYLMRRLMRRRQWCRTGWCRLVAGLVILQGGLGVVRVLSGVSLGDLEVLGLPQVATKLLHWTPADYEARRTLVGFVALASPVVGAGLALCFAWPRVVGRLRQLVFRSRALSLGRSASRLGALLPACLALWLVVPPRSWAGDEPLVLGPADASAAEAPAGPGDDAVAAVGPSIVSILGEPFRYTYTVNGKPQVIRGMDYNVAYAGRDRAWRAARYDRDFAMMRAAGFNTLAGYDEREFDDLTLNKAHQYGLGVFWPYYFPPDGDYADPVFCEEQRARVLELVAGYGGHPALRMWGLGSEVLHDMPQEDHGERAHAFAHFYATLITEVHALDPNHPVLYRDSEDVWLGPLRQELVGRGLEQSWIVYGANIFTVRLQQLIEDWPNQGLHVPLLISEYGPTGFGPEARPGMLAAMWDMVREGRSYVLGGSIYAWTTEGIEATDRVYGLVDDSGQPVDGALAGIAERFGARARSAAAISSSLEPTAVSAIRYR